MFSKLFKSVISTALVLSLISSFAEAKRLGAELWGTNGDADAKFMGEVVAKLPELGFVLSDPHPKINMAYKQMGETTLDNLGFFSIANDGKMRTLLEQYPALGGFTPFNLHIYKFTNEDRTYVGHLRPEVMADIVGLEDVKLRKEFSAIFPELDSLVLKGMESTSVKNLYFDSLPESPLMRFTYSVDLSEVDDLEEWVEEFQEEFEEMFEEAGYLIAGYKNIKEGYDLNDKEFKFPAYWVYSLCHFPFSYAVFNEHPEIGVFAPCSLFMYVDEDEETLHIGMPKLSNWITIANITDPEKVKLMNDLDVDIIRLFGELGAVEVK
jgi:uncharacterized protein (DUF302 family)